MTRPNWQARLADAALGLTYPTMPADSARGQRIRSDLETRVDEIVANADEGLRAKLQKVPKQGAPPEGLAEVLLGLIAGSVLQPPGSAPPAQPPPLEVLISAARVAIHHSTANDRRTVTTWQNTQNSQGAHDMSIHFVPDPRGLSGFTNAVKHRFETAIDKFIERYDFHDSSGVLKAFIGGKLLLASQLDPSVAGWYDIAKQAYDLAFLDSAAMDGKDRQANLATLDGVANNLGAVKGGGEVTYQELAAVGQYVLDHLDQTPYDDPNFGRSVSSGLDAYVAGGRTFDTLDLPPVVGEEGAGDDVAPDNLRACSMIYAALQLDRVLLFDVVDRIAEQFSQGLVPVGLNAAGRLLDQYLWDITKRMDPASRHEQFARIFAAPGGDLPPDVVANKNFDDLWIRFLSSVEERDRALRVSVVVGSQQSQVVSTEYVRKAGRDLAANLSSYGWAYTHFAARRMGAQIRTCIDIISRPEIQKAYGVTTPWQVVERVANLELGVQPDITRYRTMAKAGKDIVDILANKADAFTASGSSRSLFPPIGGGDSNFTQAEYLALLTAVENWLAVNGVQTDSVDKYAEPVEAVARPSLPVVGSKPAAAAPGSPGIDQIRQMVSQGQTPSLEQLQKLLPAGV